MPITTNIDRFPHLIRQSIDIMQSTAENILNPCRYRLSDEAKRRLKWIYIIHHQCGGNISKAARQIGISRQWLSSINSRWLQSGKDPRSLAPHSKAPLDTSKRNRITKATEDKIVALRKQFPVWGKEKIAKLMWTNHKIKVNPSTVNRYLRKHGLINPKLSSKNKLAWKNKTIKQKQKIRPPSCIKDYKPGALVEKDMKFVPKPVRFTNPEIPKAQENFYYQHTENDSFTRIRTLELVTAADSKTALESHQKACQRFPFPVVCFNTDSGGENGKDFAEHLAEEQMVHFFSRTGTPTDNPRVERSHLTDELEFYTQGNFRKEYNELKKAMSNWEHTYNYTRPHQALGYLTPIEFYQLWKKDPDKAYQIKDKWQTYLKKQRERHNTARRLKKKEEIDQLMQYIDSKLTTPKCQ